jgi:nicotinate-nucleotide adenylyltransferase
MQWERVYYVPAFRQPFKRDRDTAAGPHRFAMAALATLDYDELFVFPNELERGAISYTVDTLEEFRETHVDDTLDWVIGDDNLAQLLEWKSIDRIFELANFTVLARGDDHSPPAPLPAERGEGGRRPGEGSRVPASIEHRVTDAAQRPRCGAIVFVTNPLVPVSSTEIRRRVRAQESIDDLVDARVSRYIQHYGLYRKEEP